MKSDKLLSSFILVGTLLCSSTRTSAYEMSFMTYRFPYPFGGYSGIGASDAVREEYLRTQQAWQNLRDVPADPHGSEVENRRRAAAVLDNFLATERDQVATSYREISEMARRIDYQNPGSPAYAHRAMIQTCLQRLAQANPRFEQSCSFQLTPEERSNPRLARFNQALIDAAARISYHSGISQNVASYCDAIPSAACSAIVHTNDHPLTAPAVMRQNGADVNTTVVSGDRIARQIQSSIADTQRRPASATSPEAEIAALRRQNRQLSEALARVANDHSCHVDESVLALIGTPPNRRHHRHGAGALRETDGLPSRDESATALAQ